MSGKKMTVSLSSDGLDALIAELGRMRASVEQGTPDLVRTLAKNAASSAGNSFSTAKYSGTNDVKTRWEEREPCTAVVKAEGNATLFIEYGTGVSYPDNHPQKPAGVLGHGEYGKGNGKKSAWGYYGDPGNAAIKVIKRDKGTLVITKGNPANRCMYDAEKGVEQRFAEAARSVFK